MLCGNTETAADSDASLSNVGFVDRGIEGLTIRR
jgi:hypothetical protein